MSGGSSRAVLVAPAVMVAGAVVVAQAVVMAPAEVVATSFITRRSGAGRCAVDPDAVMGSGGGEARWSVGEMSPSQGHVRMRAMVRPIRVSLAQGHPAQREQARQGRQKESASLLSRKSSVH